MKRRIVDLTFPIHEGMPTFPAYWHPWVEVTQLGRHGMENRETRKLILGTHTGTHCDAPLHFIPGGISVDQIPLETLIGPASVIDFSKLPERHAITVAELKAHCPAKLPERLILRFDWSRHWGDSRYYVDHPYLTPEAAQWVIDSGVKLIAMDTPMPDNPADGKGTANDSPIHKIILGGGLVLVEYLCGLDQLRQKEVELIVLPIKVRGADGAPVRCAAIEHEA